MKFSTEDLEEFTRAVAELTPRDLEQMAARTALEIPVLSHVAGDRSRGFVERRKAAAVLGVKHEQVQMYRELAEQVREQGHELVGELGEDEVARLLGITMKVEPEEPDD